MNLIKHVTFVLHRVTVHDACARACSQRICEMHVSQIRGTVRQLKIGLESAKLMGHSPVPADHAKTVRIQSLASQSVHHYK